MSESVEGAVAGLVSELGDFRARSSAMRALVNPGRPAVEPLIQALESRNEGMRWATAECLSQIGESSLAVPAFIRLLERDGDQTGAARALTRLTDKPFGSDTAKWTEWWQRRHATVGHEEADTQRVQFAELLLQALSEYNAVWRRKRNGYSISLQLDDNPPREIRVLTDRRDRDGSNIVIIYSVCCPARAEPLEWGSRENPAKGFGSLAVLNVAGERRFVAYHTLLLEGLSRTELRKALVAVCRKASAVDRRDA